MKKKENLDPASASISHLKNGESKWYIKIERHGGLSKK